MMKAFIIFVEGDIKRCLQDERVIRYSTNTSEESCRASKEGQGDGASSGDGCGLRYWTGSSLDPSPLFPVYI